MEIRKSAALGLKWITVGNIGLSAFQLIQISILTRLLHKEDFGLIAMALFILRLIDILADMGLTVAILHKQKSTTREYSSLFWLNFSISFILYIVLILLTPSFAKFYNEETLGDIIPLLGLNILLFAIGRQHRTILQKELSFKIIAVTEIVSYLCGFCVAVPMAYKGFGVYSLVFSSLTSALISNVAFFLMNKKKHPIKFHFSLKETKSFFTIGSYSMGSRLIDFLSRDADVLIIGKMLGAESLGIYSLVKNIVLKFFSVINPTVTSVFTPLLASIQNDAKRLEAVYLKLVKQLSIVNFLVFGFIIVLSRELLYYLYGSEYSEYFPVLAAIAFAYAIVAISNPVSSLQIAKGRTDIGFQWTIFRVLISPLVVYFSSLYNIQTVALYYALLSLFLIVPMWGIQIRRLSKISFGNYVRQFYRPLLFFISLSIIVYLVGDRMFVSHLIFNGILKSIILLLTYGTFLFVLERNEVRELYTLIIPKLKIK